MNNSGKNEFKGLLVRCFGDIAESILDYPSEAILKCSMESLNSFMNSANGYIIAEAVENPDDRLFDAFTTLRNTYERVNVNLEYFNDREMSRYAKKYLEDNHIDLSTENGVREFVLFEDCMKRHKKDFLNYDFAVEEFLIPDIFHVFLDDTLSMFVEEQESAVFSNVTSRVA